MDEKIERALIYGSLATGVVSLLSLSGAFFAPLFREKTKHRWMQFFVALAVSTMASDAILHIIPEIMGHHKHAAHTPLTIDEEDIGNLTNLIKNTSTEAPPLEFVEVGHEHDHHEHDEDEGPIQWDTMTDERITLLRLSVILLVVTGLYFIEFFIYCRKQSHIKAARRAVKCQTTVSNHAWSECEKNNNEKDTEKENEEGASTASNSRTCSVTEVAPSSEETINERIFCGLTSRAMVILFGDALHNLVDGVAIGTSFLVSDTIGLITTVAVMCHELPHEIGDFAVLIDSGLSVVKALVLNLISALTAFLGLFLAVLVGRNEHYEKLLLCVTAGMFIYVAWIDMLAHLKHDASHKDHWSVAFVVQLSGFVLGFSLIFTLGWFEDQLFH